MKECVAKAFLFSGRPDPTWEIEQSVTVELEKIWSCLGAMQDEPPRVPGLGYRGCLIRCENGTEWFVYKSFVRLNRPGESESRQDGSMKFERLVISSAPEGLVPAHLVENRGFK